MRLETDDQQPPGIRELKRDDAVRILTKRMMIVGGVLGAIMSGIWMVIGSLMFPAFPAFGSPPFLIFLITSLVLLAGAGVLAGRRYVKRLSE